MLSVKHIVLRYDSVEAVRGVSMEVKKGTITALIGANGAGKSTCLKAVSGLIPVYSGEIWFDNKRIDGMQPEKIVNLGVVHIPEGKQLFLEMSVIDNLMTGAFLRMNKANIVKDLNRVFSYFPDLYKARYRQASKLSGGQQQMLAIGRGLMADPKLLLLDEPSLGLSPLLTQEVGFIIQKVAKDGVSILLIEQNANMALELASNGYVLENGKIAIKGDSDFLRDNEHVRKAYLGL